MKNNQRIFNIYCLLIIGIFVLSLLIISLYPVKAETIIYDNFTTSNYKLLKIDDATNIKYLNEYPYEIYINGSYYGTFKKDDKIFIPDGSDIIVYVPSPIKTDFSQSYDIGKIFLTLGIFGIIGIFGFIIVGLWILNKIWSKRK